MNLYESMNKSFDAARKAILNEDATSAVRAKDDNDAAYRRSHKQTNARNRDNGRNNTGLWALIDKHVGGLDKYLQTGSLKEDLGDDVEKYQMWVDYDMKRYKKISAATNAAIKKAGLSIVKDDYGDYEVIAGKNSRMWDEIEKHTGYDVDHYMESSSGKNPRMWDEVEKHTGIDPVTGRATNNSASRSSTNSKKQPRMWDEIEKHTGYDVDHYMECDARNSKRKKNVSKRLKESEDDTFTLDVDIDEDVWDLIDNALIGCNADIVAALNALYDNEGTIIDFELGDKPTITLTLNNDFANTDVLLNELPDTDIWYDDIFADYQVDRDLVNHYRSFGGLSDLIEYENEWQQRAAEAEDGTDTNDDDYEYDDEDDDDGEYYEESLKEDTVKTSKGWTNKGKEGEHGVFKTKRAADAQRKAMFANGYKAK